jgi:hypothetical protein
MLSLNPTTKKTAAEDDSELILLYHPALAAAMRRLHVHHPGEAAIFLNQNAFWLQTNSGYLTRDGRKWIYNSYEDWREQIPSLSAWQIGQMVRDLEKLGLIEKKCFARLHHDLVERPSVAWHEWNTSSWITLNVEKLVELCHWHPFGDKRKVRASQRKGQSFENPHKPLSDAEIAITTSKDCNFNDERLQVQHPSIYRDNQKVAVADESEKSLKNPIPTDDESYNHSLSSTLVVESTTATVHEDTAESDEESEPDNSPGEIITAVISSEEEEEYRKLTEIRSTIEKLTPRLKALALDYTFQEIQAALAFYKEKNKKDPICYPAQWLEGCLRGRWWQDTARQSSAPRSNTGKDKDAEAPKPLAERLAPELKSWYEWAVSEGICLPAPLLELPEKMGRLCARVLLVNRRPYDPPFETRPIEELAREYPRPEHD